MSPSRSGSARSSRSSACSRCRCEGPSAAREMMQARGMAWTTILVPHDFSTSANHALAIARDEAKHHGATIVLLHVIDLPYQLGPDAVIVPPETGAPIGLKEYAI